jgi:hypothetical protein
VAAKPSALNEMLCGDAATENKMDLQIGKEYLVSHSRKGTFTGRVKAIDDTWATLEITSGRAGAMMAYNEVGIGEDVTVRLTHCRFTDQPTAA